MLLGKKTVLISPHRRRERKFPTTSLFPRPKLVKPRIHQPCRQLRDLLTPAVNNKLLSGSLFPSVEDQWVPSQFLDVYSVSRTCRAHLTVVTAVRRSACGRQRCLQWSDVHLVNRTPVIPHSLSFALNTFPQQV
ncbi:hypothetical protein KIL84_002396 [Mauremys mutica]|uniref:Uncharacterized protein n=1 Tax=Mauremys mutica TaxID=74926 RepID=A0A9D4AS91_9SAUR|nr:hypothetical protein KIL84_002396 [Mauremys mutica]